MKEHSRCYLISPFFRSLGSRKCFSYSVARLGAAPVCQSLHKQKPNFPLRTNQHLFSISALLWSAPSPVTFQRVSLILPCSLSLFKVFSLSFGLGVSDVWIKSLTSSTVCYRYCWSVRQKYEQSPAFGLLCWSVKGGWFCRVCHWVRSRIGKPRSGEREGIGENYFNAAFLTWNWIWCKFRKSLTCFRKS